MKFFKNFLSDPIPIFVFLSKINNKQKIDIRFKDVYMYYGNM